MRRVTDTKKPTRTSPATAAVAAGLLAALASSFIGPRVWAAMETSQELTLAVMLAAFAVGAVPTYLAMRARAAG